MDFFSDNILTIIVVLLGAVVGYKLGQFILILLPYLFAFFRWLYKRTIDFGIGIYAVVLFVAKGFTKLYRVLTRRERLFRRPISWYSIQFVRFIKYYVIAIVCGLVFAALLVANNYWHMDVHIVVYVALCNFALFSFIGFLRRTIKGDRDFLIYASNDCFSVSGYKGKGKDLLCYFFACQGPHYSNIRYNDMSIPFDVKELNVGQNNYIDLINGIYHPIKKLFRENIPVILSDMGIYAASHMDKDIKKKFESMAIAIAVWRHLYNAPIGYNVQCHERVQLLIREQASVFFRVLSSEVFYFFGHRIAVTDVVYYQDAKGLEARIMPLECPLFASTETKEYVEQLNLERYQKYGEVRQCKLVQELGDNSYDTRIFHNYLFGYPAGTVPAQEELPAEYDLYIDDIQLRLSPLLYRARKIDIPW